MIPFIVINIDELQIVTQIIRGGGRHFIDERKYIFKDLRGIILDRHFSQDFLVEIRGEGLQQELATIDIVDQIILIRICLLLYRILNLLHIELPHTGYQIKI